MRFIIYIIIIFFQGHLLIGQDSGIHILNDNIYGDISDGMPDSTSLVKTKNRKGIITELGHVALRDGKATNLKVGHWKEFNEDGGITKEGIL